MERIDLTLAALGDPTRRRIIEMLAATGGEIRLTDISARFDMSRQAVTKHIDQLCDAGLVTSQRLGRERHSRLRPNAFDGIRDWLKRYDRFWDERLGDLKSKVEEEFENEKRD